METIRIVLDKALLQATDRAARRMKRNHSAWVREALRQHLKRIEVRTNEERDREGYSRQLQSSDESRFWGGAGGAARLSSVRMKDIWAGISVNPRAA